MKLAAEDSKAIKSYVDKNPGSLLVMIQTGMIDLSQLVQILKA